MTRYFLDACYPVGFQPNYAGYHSYCDGRCAFQPNPGGFATRYIISSLASNCGIIGDVEPGNPYWPMWISWVQQRRAAGEDPTLYCCDDGYGSSYFNGWRHADGVAAFQAAAVREPHWWIFNQTNGGAIPPYAVANQFATGVKLDGINEVDLSTALDYWPGVDPLSPPVVTKEKDMPILYGVENNQGVWMLAGNHYSHVMEQRNVDAMTAVGVPIVQNISTAFHQQLQALYP